MQYYIKDLIYKICSTSLNKSKISLIVFNINYVSKKFILT